MTQNETKQTESDNNATIKTIRLILFDFFINRISCRRLQQQFTYVSDRFMRKQCA